MDKNKENFERHQKIIQLGKYGGEIRWEKGKLLLEQKKTNGWKGLADSWMSYLADPELGETIQTLERHMRVYSFYGEKLGLKYKDVEGIDVKKLEKMRSANLITKKNLEEWLDKARNWSYSDFLRVVEFGEKDVMKCKHSKVKAIPPKYKCLDCGQVFNQRPNDKS